MRFNEITIYDLKSSVRVPNTQFVHGDPWGQVRYSTLQEGHHDLGEAASGSGLRGL